MTKPYMTKIWWGRWWYYRATRRRYKLRMGKLGYHWGITSYKISKGP